MDETTQHKSASAPRLPRLPELDGLRALLAWWVVVFHASGTTFSAAFDVKRGPLSFLSNGSLAVHVFMILSGFVIFFLIDREHEPYGRFTLRRFLRLYPVFAVCFVATLAMHDLYVGNLLAMGPHLGPEALAKVLHNAEQPMRDLGAQLAVHIPMLHGMIPDAWLYNAAGAFLMPAWSISLEWQFYLVAPLLAWMIRRGRGGVAALAAVTLLAFVTRGLWPKFRFDAFLPLQLHLFVLGIASYYVFKRVALGIERPAWLVRGPDIVVVAVSIFLALQIARLGLSRGTTPADWFPLAIWAFVFAVLLAAAAGGDGWLVRTTRRVLRWPPLERLGVVSYSTYLVHWPVLVLCQALFRTVLDHPSPRTLFVLHIAISMPIVAALSFALYRLVEAPGMAYGRKLARRLAPRG